MIITVNPQVLLQFTPRIITVNPQVLIQLTPKYYYS